MWRSISTGVSQDRVLPYSKEWNACRTEACSGPRAHIVSRREKLRICARQKATDGEACALGAERAVVGRGYVRHGH